MRRPLQSEIISASFVTSHLPWRDLEFHDEIGSTNDRARELVAQYAADPAGAPDPTWRVVLTDHQVGGRGRLGRSWQVPAGAAVAVSVIVPTPDPAAVAWLPLVTGLALARAVRDVTQQVGHPLTPRLKWPNDVLLADDDDRKLSGILCELVAAGEGRHVVVVGAGINVDQRRDELPVPTATSLALAGATVQREALVVAYLQALAPVLHTVLAAAHPERSAHAGHAGHAGRSGEPARAMLDLRAAYAAQCSTIGAQVRVHLPHGEEVEGLATAVDASGGLVVRTPTGARTFAAGDVVHVRRPDGRLA